jgi:hypothetical protein
MEPNRLALVGTLCACAALAACTPEGVRDGRQRAEAEAADRWAVTVSVEPEHSGPIAVSVGAMRRTPPNDARRRLRRHAGRGRQWLLHEIVFENTGGRQVRFADTRTAKFIGPSGHRRRLVAADEGCGYGPATDPRLEFVCLLYLDAPVVKPGASVSRMVTLVKGLRGMEPLTEGRYVFRKVIRFRTGRTGNEHTAVLRLVYDVAR